LIHERGKRWRVVVQAGRDPLTGKRYQLSGSAATEREALAMEREFRRRVEAGITGRILAPGCPCNREVAEEACARVTDHRYLACQHVWDPHAPDGPTSHYQTRWWARVELDPWEPQHGIVQRQLVPPGRVTATLSWQRTAIAERLLAAAVAIDHVSTDPHRPGETAP
jgi:hypothetical protein